MSAARRQNHRLARRKEIRPVDLADEVFVTQPSSVPQIWRDHWLLVDELGERPRTSPHIGAQASEYER